MCISVQQITYIHPDKEMLFHDLSFSVSKGQKVALVGNNGVGKSTLLQIMNGNLSVSSGEIIRGSLPYYIPQHFGQYNGMTVAQALDIDSKLNALHAILGGDATDKNFAVLADDWSIEERALSALASWGLEHISLSSSLNELSGGEKTKVFLAGINIHQPEFILMDEPTNHLDYLSREKLYEFIASSRATIIVVSHDRTLLNRLTGIYELSKSSMSYYPGNYEFYKEQKGIELDSLQARLEEKEKEMRQARKIARETAERSQKRDVRNKKKEEKGGIPRIMVNMLRNKAEKSTSKLNDVHDQKMGAIAENIADIRSALPDKKAMKTDFNTSSLHTGKILVTAKDVNFGYGDTLLWKHAFDFQIKSGERILIKGGNGSGKTTLLKLITGELQPSEGEMSLSDFKYVFLDQEYSIINNSLTVFEQVRQFSNELQDHEIKTILNRFLFSYETWDKTCDKLSGGEKMKLALCCLMVGANTPDVFILDEPTNNIDISNIEILTSTIKEYKGTVLLVSHDNYFADQIGIDYEIVVDNNRL